MILGALGGRRRQGITTTTTTTVAGTTTTTTTVAGTPTPFEASGYVTLTTLSEEIAYLQGLAADYPTIAYQAAATTLGGRDVPMAVIGSGNGTPIYGRATIHGNEVAAREVALSFVRRAATSTDPDVVAFLANHKMYLITTASPDAVAAGVRETANVDLNRDNIRASSVEVGATFAQIVARRPLAYIDMHEAGAVSSAGEPFSATFGIHRLGSSSLAQFSLTAINRSIKAAMTAAGKTMRWYPSSPNPEIAQQAVQMHGVPATLTETAWDGPLALRFEDGSIATWAWFLDICKNTTAYQAAIDAAEAEIAGRAVAGTPWSVDGRYETGALVGATGTLVTATGYTMTAAQYTATAQQALAAHGVTVTESGGVYSVALNSVSSAWAVALLDPSSPAKVTTATRLS